MAKNVRFSDDWAGTEIQLLASGDTGCARVSQDAFCGQVHRHGLNGCGRLVAEPVACVEQVGIGAGLNYTNLLVTGSGCADSEYGRDRAADQ